MPDGKADRHILPSNSYRSGSRAAGAFAKLIESENIAKGEEAERLTRKFAEMLAQAETNRT